MINLSYYTKCFNSQEQEVKTFTDIIAMIRSTTLKHHTDYLRKETDKEKRDEYKKKHLPCVIFQGVFSQRGNDYLSHASGLACLDIDDYEGDPHKIKAELIKEESVLAVFLSPSGGVKFIVRIPKVKNDQQYKIAYAQLLDHFRKYSPKQDEKTKDISRLCFLSHDPDAYSNQVVPEFEIDWKKKPPVSKEGTKFDMPAMIKGVPQGDRDNYAFKLACRCKGKKLSKHETYLLVKQWNVQNTPPLPEKDIKKCVDSAFRYESDTNGDDTIKLKDVHDMYQKLLYIEDTCRIDVILATALSRKLEGIPLWLILVGPSGDMKSVQLNAFEDDENTFVLHNLTSKTLVNGFKDKTKYPDLAPKLHNKLIVIPDMAQILKLPPIEKGELWGQLRDLYDGLAGKSSGLGSVTKYKGLKVTLLAGSTPAIDAQILVHQDLGTRELIYRTFGSKHKGKVVNICFENETMESEIKGQLKGVTMEFLNKKEMVRGEVSTDDLEQIKNLAIYVTQMRASAEFDNYTNELRNYVYPEEPTRIAKQLKRMYVCLKALDPEYPTKKAFKILWHIAKSSAFPVRTRIFDFFATHKTEEHSTSSLAELLSIGKSTAKRECLVMENIGILRCRRVETSFPDRFYEYWSLNTNNKTVHEYITIYEQYKSNIYDVSISLDGLQKTPIISDKEVLGIFSEKTDYSFDFIVNYFGKDKENEVKSAVDRLVQKGEIVPSGGCKPDHWRLLS